MKWHDLVFSDEPRLRYRRHAIFWLAWLVYFGGTFFYRQQPFISEGLLLWIFLVLVKSIFVLVGHAFICYVTVYFLLPQFLLKRKYLSFAGILMGTGLVVTAWTYFCYGGIIPLIDTVFNSSTSVSKNIFLWNSLMAGLLSALKLVAVAITIKLLKRWWQKQNENMRLEKEKINVELQLLKAQIHPDFLFSSLDKIYYYAQNDSARAASLLLKLSDLLSYMLYECNGQYVTVEKEIKMLRDYLELEKKRLGGRLDIDIQVKGAATGKMIAPLLLLPFIENSFLFCENESMEKCWLNLDIRITERDFSMKLINGKTADAEITSSLIEAGLTNVQKRLDIIYQDGYELKVTIETDYMITSLKIQLEECARPATLIEENSNTIDQNQVTPYATI